MNWGFQRYRGHAVVLFAAFFIAACNTTGSMPIPESQSSEPVEITTPLTEQATFVLSKIIANIRRGETIAHFPGMGVDGVDGSYCNYSYQGDSTLEWGSGTSVLGNWSTELGEIFHEVLSARGLNIAGDPTDMFGRRDSAGSAEYLIGARIKKISGNICEAHHWSDGRPLNRYSGEMFMEVEWTVFASLSQRVVLKVTTTGYHKQKKSKRQGVILMFHQAFASASENFANDGEFIRIALNETPDDETAEASDPVLVFEARKEGDKGMDTIVDTVLASVVTLRLGGGHGSGFLISENGLILTNAHVVGESRKIGVILNNGLELEGRILRRNVKRDVALIKVAVRARSVLPIRLAPVRRLERVFVVGSPLKEDLHSTVTTGIVSAIRRDTNSGLRFIQSDAAISLGNSGGPLLDANGNVVGISVLKFLQRGTESLNMFIPIGDALEALNLRKGKIVK